MSEKQNISISPEGVEYALPVQEDYAKEFERVRQLADAAKTNGQEIVVVMGVGFVGAVMAAIVADAVGEDGRPSKFVIGMQRPYAGGKCDQTVCNRQEELAVLQAHRLARRQVLHYIAWWRRLRPTGWSPTGICGSCLTGCRMPRHRMITGNSRRHTSTGESSTQPSPYGVNSTLTEEAKGKAVSE